jgi:hypothetical protein
MRGQPQTSHPLPNRSVQPCPVSFFLLEKVPSLVCLSNKARHISLPLYPAPLSAPTPPFVCAAIRPIPSNLPPAQTHLRQPLQRDVAL